MTQSDQPQRELVPFPSSQLFALQKTDTFGQAENEQIAIRAFIEYLLTFQEEVSHSTDYGHDHDIPFDTGLYYLERYDLPASLDSLTQLLNETLRKKTVARFGRKPLELWPISHLLQGISCYLGFYNIAAGNSICSDERSAPFSLATMFYARSGGFLEPLSEEELQELSDTAIADMLARRQNDAENFFARRVPDLDNGVETNFVHCPSNKRFHEGCPCRYHGSPKKYRFANDEAKHAAEAIVAAESVRLRLFLEALQGTLRFLDRLTRLSDYRERQVPLLKNDKERDRKLVEGIISLLHTLLVDETARQDGMQQQEEETNVVESEPMQTIENTKEAMNREQGIPNDVIAWLLANKKQPVHPSISSFTDMYLKRLVAASKEKVTHREDGITVLPRWKSPEGGSYGYNPAEIAYHLGKLDSLLYEVTHSKQTKDIRLDGETLLTFSTLFGFYNLCSYFLYCQQEYTTNLADKINKNSLISLLSIEEQREVTTAKWMTEACALINLFPAIDSWNEEFAFHQWIHSKISIYSEYQLKQKSPPYDAVYWFEEEGTGSSYASSSVPYKIIWKEYNRFVAFLKGLRMLCATLVEYNKSLLDTEEKQAENEQVAEATELMHVEIAGAVITLGKNEAALVVYADVKYKRRKVKVTSAHGLEVIAYLARHIDDDLYAAIFPRLLLQDGITELVVVQCDGLKVGDDDTLTLFAGNVTEVFLEE